MHQIVVSSPEMTHQDQDLQGLGTDFRNLGKHDQILISNGKNKSPRTRNCVEFVCRYQLAGWLIVLVANGYMVVVYFFRQ